MSFLGHLRFLQTLAEYSDVSSGIKAQFRNWIRSHEGQVSIQSKFFVENHRPTVRACVDYLRDQHGCGRLRNQHPELDYVRFSDFISELKDVCERYDLDLSIGLSREEDLNGQWQLVASCRGTRFFSARNWDLNFSLDSHLSSTLNKRFEIQNRLTKLPVSLAYGISLFLTSPILAFEILKHFLYYRMIVFLGTLVLCFLGVVSYGAFTGQFSDPSVVYPEWINYSILGVSVLVFFSDIFYPRNRADDHHYGYDEIAKLFARQVDLIVKDYSSKNFEIYLLGHSLAGALMVRLRAYLNYQNIRGIVFNCAPSTRGREFHPFILSFRTSSDPLTFFSSKSQSMDTNTLIRKSIKNYVLALVPLFLSGYLFLHGGPHSFSRFLGAAALWLILSYFFWTCLAIWRYFRGHFLSYISKSLE